MNLNRRAYFRGVLVQVTPYRSKAAGLLTSATVFTYTAVVLFNALSSEPAGRCVLTAGNVSSGLQVLLSVSNQQIYSYSIPCHSLKSAANEHTDLMAAICSFKCFA